MQKRSFFDILPEEKHITDDRFAIAQYYTQHFKQKNYMHYHDCLEIGMCISGSGEEFIENRLFHFESNSVSVIKKGAVHDSHIVMQTEDVPSRWMFMFIDPEKLGVKCDLPRSFISGSEEMAALFRLMFSETERQDADSRYIVKNLLKAFFAVALRECGSEMHKKNENLSEDMLKAVAFISDNYGSDITVDDIAANSNLSVSYFRKKFKEQLSCTPLEYLNDLRVSAAQDLLDSTDMSVLQISETVGFGSLSSFNRLFKRKYGCSPREMRRNSQTENTIQKYNKTVQESSYLKNLSFK